MDTGRDPELNRLLREWQVGGAPPSLDERVLGRAQPWWKFLFRGYVRVPVPVGIAAMAALALFAAFALRERMRPPELTPGAVVSLRGFQPVSQPGLRIIRGPHANQ